MATKPPSAVKEFPAESLEKIAYDSVSTIPTVEPNDRNRLAYHIWRWLSTRAGTLEEAVGESGARLNISKPEALKIIADSLATRGLPAS